MICLAGCRLPRSDVGANGGHTVIVTQKQEPGFSVDINVNKNRQKLVLELTREVFWTLDVGIN